MLFAVAPLDDYATRITMSIAYIGGVLMFPLLFAYLSNLRWFGLFIPSAFSVLLMVWLLLTYAAQPVVYRIDPTQLVIKRRWLRAMSIALDDITGVSLVTTLADIPRVGLRFAFNPGVFGYQGPFKLAPYGTLFFLATNRERFVSVGRISTSPLILSPASHTAFVAALRDAIEEHRTSFDH